MPGARRCDLCISMRDADYELNRLFLRLYRNSRRDRGSCGLKRGRCMRGRRIGGRRIGGRHCGAQKPLFNESCNGMSILGDLLAPTALTTHSCRLASESGDHTL
ncbi:hypothetical protein OH77DRAFT_572151 [Trametes cingulata]|nr:hypothetical protein OH77DRAFT_572151 [Trametes cingulata]